MSSETFRALVVSKIDKKNFIREVKNRSIDDLPDGDILVRVHYSSLNYKDGLSSIGSRGITNNYPHTPGIDASGIVVESSYSRFKEGDSVIVTSYDLGVNTSGGFGQYIRVPADWVDHLPDGLDMKESMIYGTAGFTAALAIRRLEENFITPEMGEIIVTGASGGVGTMAVSMLSSLGYEVVASTGKPYAKELLLNLGAKRILTREETNLEAKPIGSALWAGAIDQVGGNILKWILSTMKYRGACAATGLTLSPKFDSFVFPFIIRGASLIGIDSVQCPMSERASLWNRMSSELRPKSLSSMGKDISLEGIPDYLKDILLGKITGRTLVKI